MTDREALAAALELMGGISQMDERRLRPILAAARKTLVQLPEKCEHGELEPHWNAEAGTLEGVLCKGKVYPAELVERISRIANCTRNEAVAVLDALNGETE